MEILDDVVLLRSDGVGTNPPTSSHCCLDLAFFSGLGIHFGIPKFFGVIIENLWTQNYSGDRDKRNTQYTVRWRSIDILLLFPRILLHTSIWNDKYHKRRRHKIKKQDKNTNRLLVGFIHTLSDSISLLFWCHCFLVWIPIDVEKCLIAT